MASSSSFQFIQQGPKGDKGSRKLIRSHVMKGKNSGRKLPPRGRSGALARDAVTAAVSAQGAEDYSPSGSEDGRLARASRVRLSVAGGQLFNVFAGEEHSFFGLKENWITPRMRQLLYECGINHASTLYCLDLLTPYSRFFGGGSFIPSSMVPAQSRHELPVVFLDHHKPCLYACPNSD
jgi:hypothetical protein